MSHDLITLVTLVMGVNFSMRQTESPNKISNLYLPLCLTIATSKDYPESRIQRTVKMIS